MSAHDDEAPSSSLLDYALDNADLARGFFYIRDFITADEERSILAKVSGGGGMGVVKYARVLIVHHDEFARALETEKQEGRE